MLCGNCRGDGYLLIKLDDGKDKIEYIAEDCPECLGIGEIQSEDTPRYPDSHGNDDY